MKPTYEELIQLNSYLKNKNKKDVDDLVDAIIECGYEWNDERKEFWHPKIQQGIKTSGLDMFDAERLRKTYDEAWGKPKVAKRTKNRCFFYQIISMEYSFFHH